jgi:hypothetical protein
MLMDTKRIDENLHESNEVGIRLLLTDAEIALTLLDTAEASSDAEGRSRRIQEARKAFDSILHLLPRFTLDAAQSEELDVRMSLLRKRLVEAGAI